MPACCLASYVWERRSTSKGTEAAPYAHVVPSTMYRWIKDGRVRATKIGGRWYIRRQAIKQLVEKAPPLSKGKRERLQLLFRGGLAPQMRKAPGGTRGQIRHELPES